MIVLHHCISARSFRPLWMLEELQLPYKLVVLPFPPRVHAREFLAINPLGTVPAFFDRGAVMTESAAICEYLATTYGGGRLSVRASSASFAAYLNWLHFGEATLTFPQTLILRYGRFEQEDRRSAQVVTDYTRWFLARLRGIDETLANNLWLCGDDFTAADVSVGYALMLADYLGLSGYFPAAVSDYWVRLQRREAYTRALSAQHSAATDQAVSTTPAPLVQ